jgi:hypothetical protein
MTPLFTLILNRLSKSQQELLIYAAQECICQFVEYEPGKYIGVDAQYNSKLVPEQEEGLWSIGRIKETVRR